LRWLAPQPLSQPEQEIEATELGPSCLQFLNNNSSSVYTNQVLEYNLQGLNRTGDVSEDCLRLSVYAPTEKKRRSCDSKKGEGYGRGCGRGGKGKGLPVLIYFYGGGFGKFGLVSSSLTTRAKTF
jgi:cholinesterase